MKFLSFLLDLVRYSSGSLADNFKIADINPVLVTPLYPFNLYLDVSILIILYCHKLHCCNGRVNFFYPASSLSVWVYNYNNDDKIIPIPTFDSEAWRIAARDKGRRGHIIQLDEDDDYYIPTANSPQKPLPQCLRIFTDTGSCNSLGRPENCCNFNEILVS